MVVVSVRVKKPGYSRNGDHQLEVDQLGERTSGPKRTIAIGPRGLTSGPEQKFVLCSRIRCQCTIAIGPRGLTLTTVWPLRKTCSMAQDVPDFPSQQQDSIPMESTAEEPRSSFLHATFNSVSAILGISFLSTPYALEKAGWLGLSILFAFSLICCYTAHILGRCLTLSLSYNKIAEVAFGPRARLPFTLLIQFELVAVLVGYTISMADNLARLFPHAALKLGHLEIGPEKLLLMLVFFIILPTVWLRDLTLISYLSLGGIVVYGIITVTIAYSGVFNHLGFHQPVPLLKPENLLRVSGIYAYCFAAHCAFPSVYTSLKRPSHYPKVLIVSFIFTTITYTGFAFLGGTMFGDQIRPQVSLNIPTHLTAAKVVLWLVVLLPISKYSLCLAPIALDLESKFPWACKSRSFLLASILLRTALMILIFVLAMMALPYFETMVAFIGSASGMLVAVILPSLFYLKLFRKDIPRWEIALNVLILAVGIAVGTSGTVMSIIDFVHHRKG